MEKFYRHIINHSKSIIITYIVLTLACLVLKGMVGVNYDMKDYLPENTASTVSLELMRQEFDGGIPNARVMVRDVTIPEALAYKARLLACEGVTDVTWLDDGLDIYQPLSTLDADTLETYYKDSTALFSVTIDEAKRSPAVDAIREVIGDDNAMSGEAVSTAIATASTVKEINLITILAVAFVILVLLITTPSWLEPVVVLIGLGCAIIINAGSNIIFGEISFVTNAAGTILQLAVSLDYSVFLMHRFEECKGSEPDAKTAMVNALLKSTGSILSSGLTTVIGFVALIFMRFGIGPDLGLALAKGVAISLITVFVFMPPLILALDKPLNKLRHRPLLPSFKWFGKTVYHLMIPMVCVFVLIITPSYLAADSNSFYYGSSHIFGTETQLGADTAAIEEVFGKSDTYVLMVPTGSTATETALSNALHELPEVKSIISYVDTVGAEIPMSYLDKDTLSKLVSDNYSRMVISVSADYEGEATFDLVERIRATAEDYYPGSCHLVGEGVSTYDLMDTITRDTLKVNLIAIGSVLLILLLMMKSVTLPVILVACIETAIWINLSIPYFSDTVVFYIAYLIISSVQLGATVDYAILFTDRYRENRRSMGKKDAVIETVSAVTVSIITSASVMAAVGFFLGKLSSHGILSQLGLFVGKGAILSLVIVLYVLPGLLYIFDRLVCRGNKKKTQEAKFENKFSNIVLCFSAIGAEILAKPKPHNSGERICFAKQSMIIKMRNILHRKTGRHELPKPRKRSRVIAATLVAVLLLSLTLPVFASALSPNTPKQEVVYIKLNSDGSVREISVVNIFDLNKAGEIIDYGDYTALRNMTTSDEIVFENETVRIDTNAGKLYYEGILSKNTIPWSFAIRYYLDGVEYSAAELAGKSGALKITAAIRENPDCDSTFFENYGLQASFTLDTALCKNIVAKGATAANVGADRQLTYTILPGNEKDVTITADVTNFEMDSISVNGLPLNMDVNVDMESNEDFNEAIADLEKATLELDDGAGELLDGAEELRDGADELRDGTADLRDGANELTDGAAKARDGAGALYDGAMLLQDNMAQLDNGLTTLSAKSSELTGGAYAVFEQLCASAQTRLNAALAESGMGPVTLTPENYSAVLLGILAEMNAADAPAEVTARVEALKGQLDSYKSFYDGLTEYTSGVDESASGSGELLSGTTALLEGTIELRSGSTELYEGVAELRDGTSQLLDGAIELYNGAATLYDGTVELKDGTFEFRDKTADLGTDLKSKINDAICDMLGGDFDVSSFVSDRNTNVESVQFVITTDSIGSTEKVVADTIAAEPLTFWEKLLALFGLS